MLEENKTQGQTDIFQTSAQRFYQRLTWLIKPSPNSVHNQWTSSEDSCRDREMLSLFPEWLSHEAVTVGVSTGYPVLKMTIDSTEHVELGKWKNMVLMLQIFHIPSDLPLNGATWLHCVMLVRHICCSGETWFLQNTPQAEALQAALHDCENQKFMAALGGSGMCFQVGKNLLSAPNDGRGSGLENRAAMHLDSVGLLTLLVVSCNSFICICCGMGNHAHFSLTLSHFHLGSPYTTMHSNHFWPQTFLYF